MEDSGVPLGVPLEEFAPDSDLHVPAGGTPLVELPASQLAPRVVRRVVPRLMRQWSGPVRVEHGWMVSTLCTAALLVSEAAAFFYLGLRWH